MYHGSGWSLGYDSMIMHVWCTPEICQLGSEWLCNDAIIPCRSEPLMPWPRFENGRWGGSRGLFCCCIWHEMKRKELRLSVNRRLTGACGIGSRHPPAPRRPDPSPGSGPFVWLQDSQELTYKYQRNKEFNTTNLTRPSGLLISSRQKNSECNDRSLCNYIT